MRRPWIGLTIFTCSPLLLHFTPSLAVALEVTIRAQSDNSNGAWEFTHYCNLKPGDYLIFSNARGTWSEGNTVSGPQGPGTSWPDNFLNLTDLGVGRYEARTLTPYWDALVGYIGDISSPPPARGSYTSPNVRPKAERVFPIFPHGGTSSYWKIAEGGCLWLAFNADAYSDYTVDNSGEVEVGVEADTNWRPCPEVAPVCEHLPSFKVICSIAKEFVGGCPGIGREGQPIPQEQVPWGRLGGSGIAR